MSEADAFTSLAAKIKTLDLTAAERAALGEVFQRAQQADEPEVEGFAAPIGDMGFKTHTKPFKGSDEELQVLVDWLLEQKAEG